MRSGALIGLVRGVGMAVEWSWAGQGVRGIVERWVRRMDSWMIRLRIVVRTAVRTIDQNVFEVPATNFLGLPNHCEAIRRATGAAVSAPKPPCWTVTAITIGRFASAT